MSKMAKRGSYREHITALKDLKHEGVLFICGTSELLLSRALDKVRAGAVKAGHAYLAVEALAVNEAMITQIGAQGSLFEPATLYAFRRVEQAKSLPRLLKALPNKNLANRLTLVYRGEGAPAPLKAELTRLKARTIPCFEPWPNEIPEVVAGLAEDAGLKLKGDALRLLVEMIGHDLVAHAHEIAKLAFIFARAEGPLGAVDIGPHLGLLREDDAFQLDRLLLQKQWPKAQALTADLIARGEKGLALLGIVANHCRGVLKVSEALGRGIPPHELAGHVRLPPFVLKTYLQHLRSGLDREESRRYLAALSRCREVDAQLKSTRISEELLMARVIEDLATP